MNGGFRCILKRFFSQNASSFGKMNKKLATNYTNLTNKNKNNLCYSCNSWQKSLCDKIFLNYERYSTDFR